MKLKTQILEAKILWPNTGQISGVPKNPRLIKDHKFDKLVKSIKDDPEMLNLRELIVYPYAGQYVIIAGNMRFRACVELGILSIPCKILPEATPPEKLKAIVIKDNIGYGENDWDLLANEWDTHQLEDWGMDLPQIEGSDEDEGEELPEEKTYIPTFKFEVQCTTEAEKNNLMAELMGRGITCTDDY